MDAQGNSYSPYDIEVAGSAAEPFTEAAWYDMERTSGVVEGLGLTFNGRTAQLAPGMVRVKGSRLRRATQWTDTSPATTNTTARRDLLVARRQLTTGEGAAAVAGKTFFLVLRGTPAATPVDPTFDSANDERLWSWQVPGGGGNVITDIRDLRRPAASDAGPRGLLCRPVKISNGTGGGVKYAAPAGAPGTGYYEMGRTPDLRVSAGRAVELIANVDWINGGGLAGAGVRWERVQVSGGTNNGATAEEGFFLGGGTVDSVLPVTHRFVDTAVTVDGVYRWVLAAKTTVAGNTIGIGENAWAYLTASDVGVIPTV